jgi:DNA-binding NarL/FixJ family response regulator
VSASPAAGVVRVLLVDDDALVRAGLRMLLGGLPDLAVVGEAGDGDEGVDLATSLAPDVVLMDIRMPRRDGLSATAELLTRPDPPKVIVLTTLDTDDSVVAALRLGANGFLLKDTPPDRIVDAVRRVAAGEPMLSPGVVNRLIAAVTVRPDDRRRDVARARLAALTAREQDVATAVAQGRSNAEIAAELYLSLATVKTHVTRIFAKLGVENRVQVAICVHDAERG